MLELQCFRAFTESSTHAYCSVQMKCCFFFSEAEDCRPREYFAAVKIQAWHRGNITRAYLKFVDGKPLTSHCWLFIPTGGFSQVSERLCNIHSETMARLPRPKTRERFAEGKHSFNNAFFIQRTFFCMFFFLYYSNACSWWSFKSTTTTPQRYLLDIANV